MIILRADAARVLETGIGGPLREEVLNGFRYDDAAWVLYADGTPAAVASAHFNSAHRNAWTPYVNWVVAWTRPDLRRRGYATALSARIRYEARERGCRRLRSAVGSAEGLALHLALGDLVWGLTRQRMALVDTPLLPACLFPAGVPISVRSVTTRTAPLTEAELSALPPLHYDR